GRTRDVSKIRSAGSASHVNRCEVHCPSGRNVHHRGGVSRVATRALMATVRRRRHEAMRQRTPAGNARRSRRWMAASMERVDLAIQGTDDLEQMMSDVLDAALSVYPKGDRPYTFGLSQCSPACGRRRRSNC